MHKIIKDHYNVKSQYENCNKTDHPEYKKICEWLEKNKNKSEFKTYQKKVVRHREKTGPNPLQTELL